MSFRQHDSPPSVTPLLFCVSTLDRALPVDERALSPQLFLSFTPSAPFPLVQCAPTTRVNPSQAKQQLFHLFSRSVCTTSFMPPLVCNLHKQCMQPSPATYLARLQFYLHSANSTEAQLFAQGLPPALTLTSQTLLSLFPKLPPQPSRATHTCLSVPTLIHTLTTTTRLLPLC